MTKPREWTYQDKAILADQWKAGVMVKHIAEELGRSRSSISAKAKEMGMEPRQKREDVKGWTAKDITALKKYWAEGMSIRNIATALDRPRSRVRDQAYNYKLPSRRETMGSKGGRRVGVHLTPFLLKKVMEEAEKQGSSISFVIRERMKASYHSETRDQQRVVASGK